MMPMTNVRRLVRRGVAIFTSGALVACGEGGNGADASADASAAEAAAGPAGGAITMWTDSTELFMEHPALIVGVPDKFAVHLTDITDFAPLRSGKVTLRFTPRGGGAPVVVVQEAPRSPGIYGPSPAFTVAGVYDLLIIVDSPQARDSIRVPDLRVYANATEGPREGAETDDGIPFLKEQQWKSPGFRTDFAVEGDVAAAFEANGQIEPAAGHYADVTAPIGALVDVGGVSSSPVPGQRVSRGQTLAYLTPSLDQGGSAFAEARAALREAEDEHARALRLVAVEAVPQRRVHEAENRLRAAQEALAGLGGGTLSPNGKVAVRAPIGGVVVRRSIAPGGRVEAGSSLFTLVDASRVWLKVNVPAAQASLVNRASGAEFEVEGSARRYTARRTVSIGSVIDSLSRTVPVLYEVANGDGSLKIGATARVAVRTGQRARGLLVPASAILDEDGRAIVYVQPSGERFEKREVTVLGVEGSRAVIGAGLTRGDRVVTGAAYQVRLASLSTSVPAHGHEH
jgi:cobalt-zinc-cadmium efflux system membrane fusion protein